MASRDRQHIFLRDRSASEDYTSVRTGRGPKKPPPPADPVAHAQGLKDEYEEARQAAQGSADSAPQIEGALDGFTVEFESLPGFEHNLERAFYKATEPGSRPELKAVTVRVTAGGTVQVATVFVPVGAAGTFLGELAAYENEVTPAGNRKNIDFVERIAALRHATLEGLWTDDPATFPASGARAWWEVWLRRRDDHELDRLREYAQASELRVKPRALRIDDRIAVLVEATPEQLTAAVDVLDDLAELRKPAE